MKNNINADIFIAGLQIVMAIYAWTYIHYHPEKLSPHLQYRIFRLLCIFMIVLGSILVIAALMTSGK